MLKLQKFLFVCFCVCVFSVNFKGKKTYFENYFTFLWKPHKRQYLFMPFFLQKIFCFCFSWSKVFPLFTYKSFVEKYVEVIL